MKRLIWAILLVSAYLWSTATGRDQFVLDQGKRLYHALSAWFDDAELDFQVQVVDQTPATPVKQKKRSRLWD